MKRRVKQLNRRIFRRNLKSVLKDDLLWTIKDDLLENWVNDYEQKCFWSGCWGWYEISRHEHCQNISQDIRTN